jgi:NAD(P)-dependent dehydrogenase (short-subunit alcohol dehydrogenase family)
MTYSQLLTDKTVVVPGGTGNVGEGIVRQFLRAGARVIVPSRTESRLNDLRGHLGADADRLVGVTASYGTFDEADAFADSLGQVDHVVTSVGGWWSGATVWQTTADDWQRFFVEPATTHFALLRSFLPRLEEDGSYTAIAGFSSQSPYPGAGIVSMQGAAQLMMRDVVSAELRGQRRVNDLVLGPIINRTRPNGDPSWATADDVGEIAVLLAASAVSDARINLENQHQLAEAKARIADR